MSVSDRGKRVNLYGVDLSTGALAQLADWDLAKVLTRHSLCKNPGRDEICYFYDGVVTALDLTTLVPRPRVARLGMTGDKTRDQRPASTPQT